MGLFSQRNKEEKQNFSDIFEKMQSDFGRYFSLRMQYFKLDLAERMSKLASIITLGLIISGIMLCFFLFGFLAIAFLLGRVFQNEAIGFGIVAGVWLISFIIFFALRKNLTNYFVNLFVGIFYNVMMPKAKEEEEEEEDKNKKEKGETNA